MSRPDVLGDAAVVCAGIIVADTFVPPVSAIPQPGELLAIGAPLHQAGGCAVNTAVALNRLGVSARVAGTVGADALGQQAMDELSSLGIDTTAVARTIESATSQTVILPVLGEDRRYLHYFGANAHFTAADVDRAADGALILVVGGYLLLPGLLAADLGDVLSRIHRRGTQVILDVAIPHGSAPGMESVIPLLPYVDCFLPNRDEAEVLTGLTDPREQADAFLDAGCSSVVITSGAEGATYVDGTQLIEVSPLSVDFVDGSGSGDAFTAGLIVGLARGWSIDEALRLAAAVGASVCRGLGCSGTLFSLAEAIDQMPHVRIHHTAR